MFQITEYEGLIIHFQALWNLASVTSTLPVVEASVLVSSVYYVTKTAREKDNPRLALEPKLCHKCLGSLGGHTSGSLFPTKRALGTLSDY